MNSAAPPEYQERLLALARRKAAEFAARPELAAVALTSSVARGMTWAGSDVDLWGFAHPIAGRDAEDGFEDGAEDGIYWEIDIKPLSWLPAEIGERAWLDPPALTDDEVSPLEALWGCRVIKDVDNRLLRVKQAVDTRVDDREWLNRRAELFLTYGRGCLDGLRHADAVYAIVLAREVATRYGIAAYWMRRGLLLTSVARVPEKLAHEPQIHALYCDIFGLRGRDGYDEYVAAYQQLPAHIRKQEQRSLEIELTAASKRELYDGLVRYFRQGLPDWYGIEAVRPILALEEDPQAQKGRVLEQVTRLLGLV